MVPDRRQVLFTSFGQSREARVFHYLDNVRAHEVHGGYFYLEALNFVTQYCTLGEAIRDAIYFSDKRSD